MMLILNLYGRMLTLCGTEQCIGSLCSVSLERVANQSKLACHVPRDMAVYTKQVVSGHML